MAKLNITQLRKDVGKSANSLANLAYGAALEKFTAARARMLAAFENHSVTAELRGGPDADNISQTLDGYGNLFSFIGFHAGEDPTKIIEEQLIQLTQLSRRPHILKEGNLITFTFNVIAPTLGDIAEVTPYPDDWNSGSWAIDIEHGIPNLRYYLYKQGETIDTSRSGPGIQTKNILRGNEGFSRTKYISEIIRNFLFDVEL